MILHDVEQRSDQWYILRLGKPTASEFSKIVTSKGEHSKSAETYALTLAGELFAGKSLDAWEGNSWTERGREMEAAAIDLYEFTYDVDAQRVGFVTDDNDTMGASPDSLIGDDGMLEVKCLKAENHIKAIMYHREHHRCPPGYVQQTQGQMLICEREWCDLVFYHPDLPLLVIRQGPVEKVQQALLVHIPFLLKNRDRVLSILREDSADIPTEPEALEDGKSLAGVNIYEDTRL